MGSCACLIFYGPGLFFLLFALLFWQPTYFKNKPLCQCARNIFWRITKNYFPYLLEGDISVVNNFPIT